MLDIEQGESLLAYLRDNHHIGAHETPILHNLAGGVSNRTVLVEHADGRAWVMKQALEKLRVKVDWFSSPERIHREAAGLRWMQAAVPDASPALVFEDKTQHILAMMAVPQPHVNWKTQLLQGHIEPDYVEQFAQRLGTIQRRSLEISSTRDLFADRNFFETLRIEPYYRYSAAQVPQAATFINPLIDATAARCLTLVHGDYSPKNVLIFERRIVILDYEVIHWGDPAFDLGFSLTHFLSKAHALTVQRAEFADAARLYWSTYQREVQGLDFAADLEGYAVRHTLACLLARVAGRSPLEYLNAEQRARQQAIVLALMETVPARVDELVERFVEGISD